MYLRKVHHTDSGILLLSIFTVLHFHHSTIVLTNSLPYYLWHVANHVTFSTTLGVVKHSTLKVLSPIQIEIDDVYHIYIGRGYLLLRLKSKSRLRPDLDAMPSNLRRLQSLHR